MTFSRTPKPGSTVRVFTIFTDGLSAKRIRIHGAVSQESGDLLFVGTDGFITQGNMPSGDYTFSGEIHITGTGLYADDVDIVQLVSTAGVRIIADDDTVIGWRGLEGVPPLVGLDPPAVAAGSLGKVDLTGQVANIATTALTNTPPAGMYLVEVYLEVTTADLAAGSLAVTIGWTDGIGATTSTPITGLALTATGRATGRQLVQLASGDITYAVTVTGLYGTAVYAVYVRLVALR